MDQGGERRKRLESGATRPACMHCIQLYSDAICIQNSACKPYCRKGFGICIQCIQRISTPPLFVFFLLLGPEYMNTVNTPPPVGRNGMPCAGGAGVVSFGPSACPSKAGAISRRPTRWTPTATTCSRPRPVNPERVGAGVASSTDVDPLHMREGDCGAPVPPSLAPKAIMVVSGSWGGKEPR